MQRHTQYEPKGASHVNGLPFLFISGKESGVMQHENTDELCRKLHL
jgi:hypothetical protein